MENWLPLLTYSTKYNVSISTLRRRIKSNQVKHKLEAGKYVLLDEAPTDTEVESAPPVVAAAPVSNVEMAALASAHKLVDELKIAYAKILKEKEDQISQLKEEVADLKMLTRIMEEQSKEKKSSPSREDFFFSSDNLAKY